MEKYVSVVILAGGRGQRMGGLNKALLRLGPDSFIDRQLRICSVWTEDIVVVSNDDRFSGELRERHPVTVVGDIYHGEGPLAGIHAGLSAARHPVAWVLACDQPLASAEAASLMYARLLRDNVTAAVVSELDGRLQPLHALYRREAAGAAAELLRRGERRLLALLDSIPWIGIGVEDFAQNGISPNFADDVDTPEDYDRIQKHP